MKYYEKALKVLKFKQKPYEIIVDNMGNRGKVFIPDDRISARFAEDFSELVNSRDKNVLIKCGTSEELDFIPDKSVDAVITDPPYYDNIMYSELSDFFYVWLRLGLKDVYRDVFSPPLTEKDREILVNAAQGKTEEFYIQGMAKVFRECYRVLKD